MKKSLNVLLEEHYKAKLTDFGLAKLKTESNSIISKSPAGTFAWMAPEVINGDGCSKESDIYSLGMTIWEVASRKIPYEKANGNQVLIMNWISNEKYDEIPFDCLPKVAHLIKWCWEKDFKKRPTAEQVVDYLTTASSEINSDTDDLKSGP